MLLQYWKLKSVHFDKIALFKVGKFYELFYYDAFVAQHICDLKWMASDKKPHVGFPEMAKHDYAKRLVDAGYKVVVVEQVERVQEQQERKGEKGDGPSCVQRDACEVYTKGMLVDPEMLGGASARFAVYLHCEPSPNTVAPGQKLPFAVCMLDCATSQIQVGRMQDGPDRNALRTLLAQVQPSEILYDAANLPADVQMIVKRLPCQPQLSQLQAYSALAARDRLGRYRHSHPDKLTPAVEEVLQQDSAAVATTGVMKYLEETLLAQRVLPFATWEVLGTLGLGGAPAEAEALPAAAGRRMVLDAAALGALEVLETLEGTYSGSLLHFLDHTATPGGFRTLRQWVCAPLVDPAEIRTRSSVVGFLIAQPGLADQLRADLKRMAGSQAQRHHDLERATSRVWGFAAQSSRHAVMYEDTTAKRLGDFMALLDAYEQGIQMLAKRLPANGVQLPERLSQIARTRADGGSFPDLQEVITRLRNSMVEGPDPKTGKMKCRPAPGADAEYDAATAKIKEKEALLHKELRGIQSKHPKVSFEFFHRQTYRYEVEVEEGALPEALLSGVDVTFRNKSKVRFQTDRIKQFVQEMEHAEDAREDCIFPFLCKLFQQFHAYQAQFRAAFRLLAELDAMLSLAKASAGLHGSTCQPDIVEISDPAATGTLELVECRHPVVAAKMGSSFVPNDTLLNARGVPGCLVVTGPNMGGKSTVLRQTCIAVVMAQIGCRVNAATCRLSPMDRIFTRIGSYDALLEGKSTLLTELEETAAVLAHASRRSLAVLDELGRGTSTFDGAAIASAVLEELSERVACCALFATHYHPVSREAVQRKGIAPFHMSAEVDEGSQDMTFLYKFLPGLCPASHGHHVARLAGLPEGVLRDALGKSAEFERGREKEGAPGEARQMRGSSRDFLADAARFAAAGDAAALRRLFSSRVQLAA
mmetsp:Transcript_30510/g.85568  ORF Transcript_30510/g.85568 Transcript_30510/m.85568 type:complete len:930 (-) Transcript_30510:117-2906(-)